jgi:hypothetical protein
MPVPGLIVGHEGVADTKGYQIPNQPQALSTTNLFLFLTLAIAYKILKLRNIKKEVSCKRG